MILSLIGMSNCGKTYWSQRLESIGFKRFGCDDIIEHKLDREFKQSGLSGINDLAKWMGQPYTKKYPQTSKRYLEFEKESLDEIIRIVEKKSVHENIVIDTTGSVIYTGGKIIEQLSKLTEIIYLETPSSVRQKMYELYFRNPKPIIWDDSFKKYSGESSQDALRRCYPNLLDYRCSKYRKYAQITLDYFLLRRPDFTTDDFLKLIQRNYDFISEYPRVSQTL